MNEVAQPTADPLAESPELEDRLHRIGFQIIASTTIMFFLGFVFAYFYLRSLNNNGLWRPAGSDAPTGWGIAIYGCYALSAASFAYAAWACREGRAWIAAAGAALLLGIAGVAVQGVEYAHLSFGPRSGGYGSVFICWTALYAVFVLLTMYRVETIFAEGLRNRRQSGYRPLGFGPGSYYWTLLAGIGVISWVILYLI
jgi:heme/copper-type cytochrome/quinol oxidase subunit 3